MITKQVKNSFICVMLALLLLVVMSVSGWYISPAFADTAQYTSALEDLQKDSEFNADDYPDNEKDFSIQVIQIAESANKELFVYTYQPSQKIKYLVATDINMALSEKVDDTKIYGLTLIDCASTFCKYKVNDIIVSDEQVRYYNITSISRKWDGDIDEDTGNDNTIDYVAFPVGTIYCATTVDDTIVYTYERTDIIQIIAPYSDFLKYSDGDFPLVWEKHSDCHYVAFSTDWQINRLKSATLSYIRRDYYEEFGLFPEKSHKDTPVVDTVKATEKIHNDADGLFGKYYEFPQIMSVADFKKKTDLKKDTISALEGKQWVLLFLVTQDIERKVGITSYHTYTRVSEVTILSLEFVSAGRLFNIGAVSDRVTGDDKPGNNDTDDRASLWEWLARLTGIPEWVWMLLAALIPIAIFLPILSAIFPVVGQFLSWIVKGIGKGIKWFFIALWWVISAPFKLIVHLFSGGAKK